MALKLEDKVAVVEEVAAIAAKAHAAVASEYRGMTVGEMTELRKRARESGVYVRVVKNTLARKAVEGTSFACMQAQLTGPLFLAFSLDDPGAAARIIHGYIKEHPRLVPKLVSIGGRVFGPDDLERVSKLPTRDEALSMLLGVMKAPIEKFVRTMAEPPAKLARTLAALRDQKQQTS